MTATHLVRGRAGERLAEQHLVSLGHEILERNWRTKVGEIDLITRRDGILHFVEVKTRSTEDVMDVWESISASKRSRLARTADVYLQSAPDHRGCCFSVAFVLPMGDRYEVEFIEDAFDAPR